MTIPYYADFLHALTCPVRRRWLRHRWHMPFWRDDKVAQMLGVNRFGCPRCGRAAVEERDRLAREAAHPRSP